MKEEILGSAKIIDHHRLHRVINRIMNRISTADWRKNYRLFNQCFSRRQWINAAALGGDIECHFKDDAEFLRRLAVCNWQIGQTQSAEQHMKAALTAKLQRDPNINLNAVIQLLHQSIHEEAGSVRANYVYVGGEANFGFIEHILETPEGKKQYFTKIANLTAAGEEKRFYTEICDRYPELLQLMPKVIKILVLPGCKLCLITNEKISGRPACFDHLPEIIRLVDIMGSIRPDSTASRTAVRSKNGKYELSDHQYFPFVGFNGVFTSIDQESSNRQVFRWLEDRAEKMTCTDEACPLVRRMNEVILGGRMFERLNPVANFNFCHLNFSRENIIVDESADKYWIIDWEMYGFAPRGYSLIHFIHVYDLPFGRIKKIYLDSWFEEDLNSLIGKVFFIYPLIVSYFVRSAHMDADVFIMDHLQPAVEYLEYLNLKITTWSNGASADRYRVMAPER